MTCTPIVTTAVDKAFEHASSVTLKPFGHQVSDSAGSSRTLSHAIGGRAFLVNEI